MVAMPTKEYHQQDIVNFRPGDQVLIIQNGREMRIKIEAFIEAISNAVKDMATQADLDAIEAERAADEEQDATMIAGINTQITNQGAQINGINEWIGEQPAPLDLVVPQGGIANPAPLVSLNILGVGLAVNLATANGMRDAIVSILAALRAAKIINSTPV